MARASSSSGSGYAWALVIFGAGFVICLLLMIVFYAQLGGERERATDAEDALGKFVTRAEEGSPQVHAMLGDRAKGTVVKQLLDENTALKNMVSGDPEMSAEGLKTTIEQAGVTGNLLAAINGLNANLRAANEAVQAAQQERDAANARADAAEAEMSRVKQAFTDAQAQLAGQVDSHTNDVKGYLDKINAMDTKFQGELANIRAETQQKLDEKDQIILERDREIVTLKGKIKELIGEGGLDVTPITAPDGRIVSVVHDEDKVYIDRGRNDRVMLGMTFEVFDSGEIIKLNEFDELRGKATVEVINLDDNNAVARVVRRSRGQTIKTGDSIVNTIYDPNARLKFVVYGDFDIEGEGQPTVADRKRVEAMVSRWGGTLVQDLSPDVDFLILGAEPSQPQALPPGETNPVKIQEFVEATKAFEEWLNLRGEAEQLSVPILNQNRFLALVGYYER